MASASKLIQTTRRTSFSPATPAPLGDHTLCLRNTHGAERQKCDPAWTVTGPDTHTPTSKVQLTSVRPHPSYTNPDGQTLPIRDMAKCKLPCPTLLLYGPSLSLVKTHLTHVTGKKAKTLPGRSLTQWGGQQLAGVILTSKCITHRTHPTYVSSQKKPAITPYTHCSAERTPTGSLRDWQNRHKAHPCSLTNATAAP
jgi:hypothetical protein